MISAQSFGDFEGGSGSAPRYLCANVSFGPFVQYGIHSIEVSKLYELWRLPCMFKRNQEPSCT